MEISLQECLASRKDCSGNGRTLLFSEILELCKASQEAAPSRLLFVVLPHGKEYEGGIYTFVRKKLTLLTNAEKTKFTMELYPELSHKETLNMEDLIEVGLVWQYLSLKAESMGLGISQRARGPKKVEKLVNSLTNKEITFLYSVAVREDNDDTIIQDTTEPLRIKLEEGIHLLNTPDCYENQALYNHQYKGISLNASIFNQTERKTSNTKTLHEISQLLWACEGENDHSTHGNRDGLDKNGYGRVHASGCAGYAVYPVILVENLADLPIGAYLYNPVGFSALKRWIKVDDNLFYDHYLQRYSSTNLLSAMKEKFDVDCSHYMIIMCIDRKKPCSGFMHRKIMNTDGWAEIEAGMALAGLQLQANSLGIQWDRRVIPTPNDPEFRNLLQLDLAEASITKMAQKLNGLPKAEHLSLIGNLVPTVLFYTI
jgi:hypothetical protein